MKRTILQVLAIGIIGLPVAAIADPMQVTYDIGSYNPGGYSASWIHSATGCSGTTGPNTGLTLYMCGGPLLAVVGTITGLLDGGVLTINGGILNIDGSDYNVLVGGVLGGPTPWEISIQDYGHFLFEGMNMGPGLPNFFDGTNLILWGQNDAAYYCVPGDNSCGARYGTDLYGTVRVPEPGTLALFGLGLLGLGIAKRRKV